MLYSCSKDENIEPLYFIPQPELVEVTRGNFNLVATTKLFLPEEFIDELGPYFKQKIKNDAGLNIHVGKLDNSISSNFIRFDKIDDITIGTEGYKLKISSDKIIIKANTHAGMFNAFQTLRQTIPGDANQNIQKLVIIPCMEITDKPRFEWRGLMLDVSRHFQPKSYILKQIDIISSYKINKLHWHLTDDQGWRIEIKKYPNLTEKGAWRADRRGIHWWHREFRKPGEPTPIGGYYSQQDIREIVEYARIRNVEIIPEIDIPGHSKALIASYPFLTCRNDNLFEVSTGGPSPHNALCAGKETTYEFLNDVFHEVAALFPSEYFHIGGDECNKRDWKECEHCNNKVKANGLKDVDELQSYFITRISKQMKALGKTIIGWDEILSGKGTPGAVIMAWRRNRYSPEVDAPRAGYKTIQASYTDSYINNHQGPPELEPEAPRGIIPLKKVYHYEPVPEKLTDEEANLILGSQVCLWGEFTPNPEISELMLYPRLLANAEVGWTEPALKDWKRFQFAVENHFARLDRDQVIYSKSTYNPFVTFSIDTLKKNAKVKITPDTDIHNVYYSVNGTIPDMNSNKYDQEFITDLNSIVKAGIFNKKGILLGEIVTKRIEISEKSK